MTATAPIEALVAVRDPAVRDQLRTALLLAPGWRVATAPREQLPALLQPPCVLELAFVDLNAAATAERDFLASLRAINPTIAFASIGPSGDRGLFTQTKLELDVRTFIAAPLDPFDLARRLQRLRGGVR